MSGDLDPVGWTTLALPLGALLDATLGDPRDWPHPVRAIGRLIVGVEWLLRRVLAWSRGGPKAERLAGVALGLVVVGLTAAAAWGLTALADRLGAPWALAARTLLVYWGLAARSLGHEARLASEAPNLETARRELAMIVGRDTHDLGWPEVHRACVETVAENVSDGVVAPVFWYAVAGPVGLWAFKAVSTLDSMVGYRDARYRDLGWASARLDDLAGLVPARLTWLLIALAALLVGGRAGAALRIGWRDGRKHPSPNAGWGEAATAGALGVRLGGPATYRGVPGSKPRLGDACQPIDRASVRGAVRLMQVASILAVGFAFAWIMTRTFGAA